jgi:glycosyltransferase involved in cell wall biosynthesis
MRIGVELHQITEGATGGLVPLLQGLFQALFAGWPEHEVVLFCTPTNHGLFPAVPPHVQVLRLPPASYFPLLDVHASHLRLDVLVRSYPFSAGLAFPMARQVVLIPDLQHEFFPDFFPADVLRGRRAAFAEALGEAGAVGTLSEHARRTLLDHAPARRPDLFLVSPAPRAGGRATINDLTEGERKLLPGGEYFLYPANLWPHKNHRRVLQAFARFRERAGRPVEFVCTGCPDGWEELAQDFPGLPVRHLGFVRRGFLDVLTARARALVFFSLFEGFGMPLLEAFAAGTPVVCSDTTSLPEVGGDAVLSCDPTDVAAMSDALARVAGDEALRAGLTERGKKRLALYRWEESAARLVAACGRVAARAPRPPGPLGAVHRLNQFLEELETDREARLEIIGRLNAALRQSEADREERLGVIGRLDAALRASDADREARLEIIRRLDAALRAPPPRGGLLRRAARRLLRLFGRGAAAAAARPPDRAT